MPGKQILAISLLLLASSAYSQTDVASDLSMRTAKCHELSDVVDKDETKLADAQLACKQALDLAKKLPESKLVERINAYGDYGWTLLRAERFNDAFEMFAAEAERAEMLKPTQPKLIADASFDIARAAQGMGKTSEAKSMYLRAEKIYRQLYEAEKSEIEKAKLNGMIRRVLLLRKYIATMQEDVTTFKEVTKALADLDKQP